MNAPDTSTHCVSLEVLTVNVNAPPLLAKRVPPTVTVPVPPVNAALDTVEPDAAGAPIANTVPSDTASALTIAAADRDRFENLLFIFPTLVRRSH